MIMINQIKINPLKKVKLFLIINLFILFYITNSIAQSLELFIVLACGLYLFANCYTIRHSSLRIKILSNLLDKKKVTSELELYNDRIKRFKKKNQNIMNKTTFSLFNFIYNILRKIFI